MSSEDPVTLFYLAGSHYNEKARKVLEFKGIPYELERVPYQDHGPLLARTGQDVTPYVEFSDGSGVTWDRLADWAEDHTPTPTLFPGPDPSATRAQSHLIEDWAHRVVEDATWQWAVPDAPEQFADENERWRFVEFQERKWGDLDVMRHRRPEFEIGVHRVCRIAQDLLADKPFLLGDAPSLADLALYGGLHPLYFVGASVPKEYEGLAAWRERVDRL